MRTKSVIKIILSSTVLQVIIVISGFLLPRFFLEVYGSEINGLVSSIKQFVTYFSIAGAGIAVASNAALYEPLEKDDIAKTNGILSATKVYYYQTGYIFIGLLCLFVLIYPFMIQSSLSQFLIIIMILIIGLGAIVDQVLVNKYYVLLMADQKNHIISRTTSIGIIINTVLSILFIKLHFPVITVLLITTLTFYIRLFLIIRYVKKHYSKIDFKVKPDMQAISGRWDAFAYQISGIITAYSPVVIISIFCGLKDVSVYSIYNMVFSSLTMIVSIFSAGIAAAFGNIIAKKEKKVLDQSFSLYEYFYFAITFFCYTCALKLIMPFITIYTKGINDANYFVPLLGVLFVGSGIMSSIRNPYVTLVEAAGKYKENKNLNIYEAILNIILSILFIKSLGISAVILASFIAGTIRTALYIKYTNKNIINRSNKKVIFRFVVNVMASMIIVIIPFSNFNSSLLGWFELAIKVSFLTFIIIFTVNVLFDIKASKELFNRLKVLLKMKRFSRA